jgi:hypothetical protein
MSDILSKIQNEANQAQQFADRGQQLINDFDTDKLITQGQDYAYRMGKEQLGALLGSEVVAGIHQGLPLAYKTGQTVWNAYNRPEQTAQAFRNVISSKVQGAVDEAANGARQIVSGAEGAARNVVNETLSKSDNPYLDDGRNFRYNVADGTVETEGGAPALFGEERDVQYRTPLEQQQFENPTLPRAPVGTVPDRPEFTSGEGNFRFQAPTQSEQEALKESDRQVIQNLPDVEPAPATAPSIGKARVPGEFIPPKGQVGASYNRPGTQLEIKPASVQPNVATRPEPILDTPTQPLSQTQDLRANLAVSNETGEGDRLTHITEKYGNIVREQAQDLSKPIGSQQTFTPRQEPGGVDLEDIAPVRIRSRGTPLTQGARRVGPSLDTDPEQSVPEFTPSFDLSSNFPAPPAISGEAEPTGFPEPPPPAPTTATRGIPGVRFPEPPGGTGGTGDGVPNDIQARFNALNRTPETELQTDENLETKSAMPVDENGLPTFGPGKGPTILSNVVKAEATIAPEEEIADAIPGVGEILGGILGIGAAIEGVVQASEAPKSPPQQPMGTPASQIAFDSAPVIDSSDYHQL